MEDKEAQNVEFLRKALEEAYNKGRVDAIDVVSQALRGVLNMGAVAPDLQAGFVTAVELVEDSKRVLGLG